jgi:dimethylglycine dehydrogenase
MTRNGCCRRCPAGLTLVDETEGWSTQILTGPKARDVLAAGAEADLTKGWLTWQAGRIAGRSVFLMRVSFAGELGWEIHSRVADTAGGL